MAFRRPRINVKPNVQATRPVAAGTTGVRSQDTPVELTPTESQEEQPTQQTEVSVPIPIIHEPKPTVEEIAELTPPQYDPVPVVPKSVPTSDPIPPSSPSPLPPPTTTTTTSVPTPKPVFRIRVAPNIGVKTAIHHRRPSASCSGTESESESTRQKHSLASTITFGRIPQPSPKPTNANEIQTNSLADLPVNEDIPPPTKSEAIITETSEISTSLVDSHSTQMPSLRMSTKISREYLTQHINYRAQRLAAKVEPEMTIRKRRAATLEKLDETGLNKSGPVDTSKLKIADFVHYNPSSNPMEAKAKPTIDTYTDSVRKHSMSSTDEQAAVLAPQLKIDGNGMLVVDEDSLYIRKVDTTPRPTVIVEGQYNDDNLTHQSYRKIGRRKRWNNRDTLRFYRALQMCGTDFTLIARVFPNRDRDDIKRKFKTEDKANRTLVDSALRQRIPFDLTCFYSPSEESTDDENASDNEHSREKPPRKRRLIKRKSKQKSSSDPLEINRRREKRLQSKKNSMRVKKSAEFINDDEDEDDDDQSSMDVADTVEVVTTGMESKLEQVIPSTQNEENQLDSSVSNLTELENLLGRIDGGHLLFVHNTDETTGLDRIDVHVVMPNTIENTNEQSI